MPSVRRMVRWFSKGPDGEVVGEAELRGITLAELQELFDVPKSNPMYDCMPIGRDHVGRLGPCLSAAIQLDDYDYFVEADAAD